MLHHLKNKKTREIKEKTYSLLLRCVGLLGPLLSHFISIIHDLDRGGLEVLAYRAQQLAQAFLGLLVDFADQPVDDLVHDVGGQHMELVQLANETDVALGSASGLALLVLELILDLFAFLLGIGGRLVSLIFGLVQSFHVVPVELGLAPGDEELAERRLAIGILFVVFDDILLR